jgi:peptidoglycan/LPS O-acetylase OafA/YrhL
MGLIRLFLACVVAIDHLRSSFLGPLHKSIDTWIEYPKFGINGGYAVIYFYIISGFLISYTLQHNYANSAKGNIEFLKSRLVRIFALYWPMFIFAAIVFGLRSNTPAAILSGFFLIGSDWYTSFSSYPTMDFSNFPNVLTQAWSLGAELMFYLLAPMLIRTLPAAICICGLSLLCRLYLVGIYGFHHAWTYHFFPSTIMFFLYGHLSRIALEKFMMPLWLGPLLVAASLCISTLGIQTQRWDNLYFHAALALFALGLPGLFNLTKNVNWSNRLGDLSYPLYLTHLIALTVLFCWLPWLGKLILSLGSTANNEVSPIAIAVTVSFCILSAAVVHWTIEKPATSLLRRIFPRDKHFSSERALVNNQSEPIDEPAVKQSGCL